jgi:hypothetical protein
MHGSWAALAGAATPADTWAMTTPGRPDLAATLAKLRERFLATSDETVAVFDGLAGRLRASPADGAVIDELRQRLHRTHGTAGSYGFHASSRLASAFEVLAGAWAADQALDAPRRGELTARFAVALRASFAGDASGPAAMLLVDLPDAQGAAVADEALHRGRSPQRVAATALTPPVVDALGPGACVLASAAASLPSLAGIRVVRLEVGADPLGAVRACCEASP